MLRLLRSVRQAARTRLGGQSEQESKRVRVALIGLGSVAERIHLPACAAVRDLDLVGACEPDRARREQIARAFRIPKALPDSEALLREAQPEIVIIGAPPAEHHRLCLQALTAGAHVFCEKPFVSNLAEADEVIAEADRRGLRVAVNNQYRYMKIYRDVKERLERGELGRLFFLQCWQQMFHPPSMEKNWRTTLRQSTLYEFGTHALDLICFYFGALPASITAHTPRALPEISEADVLVQATMRFPQERLATIAFNRVSRAPMRYLEMRLDCERASVRVSLGGVARASAGWSAELKRPTFRLSAVRGGEARAESGGRSRLLAVEKKPAFASATATHLSHFIAEIKAGRTSNEDARHAREILRIALAGYESARRGETVWLDPSAKPSQT